MGAVGAGAGVLRDRRLGLGFGRATALRRRTLDVDSLMVSRMASAAAIGQIAEGALLIVNLRNLRCSWKHW